MSSPMRNRPLARWSLPIEIAYRSSVVANPGQIPRTKAEGPGTRSRPNSRKAKCIRHLQVRLVIPQHLRYPWLSYVNHKISKSINFTPKLTKRYPQGGIHAQPQPVKSILVRLNRPHLAPIRFDGKYG